MRRLAALLALSAVIPASAQFVNPVKQLSETCFFVPGSPIELTLYLDCPPSGNPPMYCQGSQEIRFTADDPGATLPPPVYVVPNQLTKSGPIKLTKRNAAVTINFVGTQDGHDFGAKTCSSKSSAKNGPR